ncbi:hypothetical protein F511_47515 [Dorcoceras hygrometricum]|uniref:Uncharacterized protein n=1 Tax=Dorcoceras hygrometricum TaxID=472368 RepID=A0A2Z6ZY26_9LAMI|nr:hypothetical protein F511_47515 [Dorcoceras hygrometricum]
MYQSQRSRRNDDFSSRAKTEDQPSRKLCASSRKHFKINSWTTSRSTMKRKTRCEVVAKGKEIISVDWIAMERKPDARYPVAVFEVSAVAQRIQRNQRSRWKESMAEIESCNCLN